MKNYNNLSALSTLNSVVGNLDRVNPTLVETITMFLEMCEPKDVGYFIKTFNEVIKKTYEQFLVIEPSARKYYIEYFVDKLDKLYHKRMDKVSDSDFASYSNCLYDAFKKSVIKNTYKYVESPVYIKAPEISKETIERKELLDKQFMSAFGVPKESMSVSNEPEEFKNENTDITEPEVKEVNLNIQKDETPGKLEIPNENTTVSDNTIERRRKIITKNFIQDNSGW